MIIALAALRQLSTSQDPGAPSSDDLVPASSCNNRTTLSIIWSCLTTIFFCTWIAVHPNLPFKGERPFVRRLKIFATGLIAPELIISWAIRQWIMSRRLARKYQAYGWTKTHGFFAIMGGFQLCERGGMSVRTLKPDELEPYLKDHTITVSEEEILDRSKDDLLSKALVLLQVSWFVLQVLARAIQHLPITELELVTLAFAILNFVIYFCWWNKPLDVHKPIKINKQSEVLVTSPGSLTPSTTSTPVLPSSNQSTFPKHLSAQRELKVHKHSDTETCDPHCGVGSPPESTPSTPDAFETTCRDGEEDLVECIPRSSTPLIFGRAGQRPTVDVELSPLLSAPDGLHHPGDDLELSAGSNHGQCSPIVNRIFPSTTSLLLPDTREDESIYLARRKVRLFIRRTCCKCTRFAHWVWCNALVFTKLWGSLIEAFWDYFILLIAGDDSEDGPYTSGTFTDKEQDAYGSLIWVVATLFGVTHCLGWHFDFPSKAEEWLWRASSIAITCIPTYIILLAVCDKDAVEWALDWVDSQLRHSKHMLMKIPLQTLKVFFSLLKYSIICIVVAGIFLYPFARIILLVQMFMVLRQPDPGIYIPVEWVTYIPHL